MRIKAYSAFNMTTITIINFENSDRVAKDTEGNEYVVMLISEAEEYPVESIYFQEGENRKYKFIRKDMIL